MAALSPSPDHLDALAQERMDDAQALFAAGRYAGAHYMCGYAMEMKVKSLICKTHGWIEYPPRACEGRLSQALKTHKLADLLLFLKIEPTIMKAAEWSVVLDWDPDQRYRPSAATAEQAQAMIQATTLLMVIL